MSELKGTSFHRRFLASLAGGTALVGAASAAQAGSPVAIPANMLPQGGHFVAGMGSIGTQGLTETITQSSQRGIIDFNSFSIGKSGTVKINNGAGATLDRVTGGSLSQIMGTLSATGSVYLVNPQGVVVGKSGIVTTGGSFVASSLDIANQNFMAGQTLRFEGKGQSDGMVKNLGSISSSGGDVFLIARSVVNSGSINAPNGTVGLGAGQEVLLKDMSVGGGRMTVRFGKGDVRNKGTIAAVQAELKAAGGNVYALAGNHSGMIRATGSAMRGGHVWLTAGGSVFAGGSIFARNHDGSGGRVTIKARKLAKVTGRIDASAASGTHSKSGGRVIVTGHDVTLGKNAVIDARGTGDGGTVLIGGDRQGGAVKAQDFAKHAIANAQTTVVEAGAQILVDGGAGGGVGNGGNVIVWSDQHTVFAGTISVTVVNATGTITPAPLTITAHDATQVVGTPDPVFSASFGPFPGGLGPSALDGTLSFTTNAPAGSPGSFKIFAGGLSSSNFDITFVPGTLLVTAANNSLPPVPFSVNQGNGTPAFSLTDPALASLIVKVSDGTGSQTGNAGGPSVNGNLQAPTLDENGNPLGPLISFNSSFIEVCRTRVNLCR